MSSMRRMSVGLCFVTSMLVGAASCVGQAPESSAPADEDVGVARAAISGAVGDWSGFTAGQCVHGVYSFYQAHFHISLPGACAAGHNIGICENCGACDIWESPAVNPPASLFNQYAWGTTLPQLYDIVVLPPSGGVTGYGHVAAVDHMTSSTPSDWQHMYVVDSNWYGNEAVCTSVHTLNRQPYGIFRLKSLDNPAPRGYLDSADCTQIAGWAQDPSVADTPINADVYWNGPAGDATASAIRLLANGHRPDLCTAIGSCDHGYSMNTPRGAMDGMPHSVYVYGIDSAGGNNPLLGNAPKTITCPAPAMPAKVEKRAIDSMDILNAWNLSTFFDMATYADADIDKVPSGSDIGSMPTLMQVKGDAEIDVLDEKSLRRIADMNSFTAWRFTSEMIQTITTKDRASYAKGADWPAAPLLIKSTDKDTVYLLDAREPKPESEGAGGSGPTTKPHHNEGGGGAAPTGDGDDASKANDSGGCSFGADPTDASGAAFALTALLGLALAWRRRTA